MSSVLSPEDRARVESESLKGLQAEDFDFLTKLFGGELKGAILLGRLLHTIKQVVLGGSFREAVIAIIDELRPQPRTTTRKPRLIGKVAPPAQRTKKAAPKRTAPEKPHGPAPEQAEEAGKSPAPPSSRRTPRRQEKTGGNGQAKAKGKQTRGKRTGGAGGRSGRPFVGPKLS